MLHCFWGLWPVSWIDKEQHYNKSELSTSEQLASNNFPTIDPGKAAYLHFPISRHSANQNQSLEKDVKTPSVWVKPEQPGQVRT